REIGPINARQVALEQEAITFFAFLQLLLGSPPLGDVAESPNPANVSSPRSLGLRMPFEDSAVLQLNQVVTLVSQVVAQTPHSSEKGLRILHLRQNQLQKLAVV